jgi:predicted TPR repeat methyltransferase
MFRLYGLIAVVGVVGAVLFGAWWEYRDMQKRIATLRENNAKLETVARANAEALQQATEFAEQMEANNLELQANLQKAEAYKDQLMSKFQKHNLTKLSLAKPGLIERRINDATKEVFDDIESLTTINSN